MDKIHALERSTNDLKIIRHKQNNLEKNQLHYLLHFETGEECPKLIRAPTLIYPVTL